MLQYLVKQELLVMKAHGLLKQHSWAAICVGVRHKSGADASQQWILVSLVSTVVITMMLDGYLET